MWYCRAALHLRGTFNPQQRKSLFQHNAYRIDNFQPCGLFADIVAKHTVCNVKTVETLRYVNEITGQNARLVLERGVLDNVGDNLLLSGFSKPNGLFLQRVQLCNVVKDGEERLFQRLHGAPDAQYQFDL